MRIIGEKCRFSYCIISFVTIDKTFKHTFKTENKILEIFILLCIKRIKLGKTTYLKKKIVNVQRPFFEELMNMCFYKNIPKDLNNFISQ